MEPVRRGVAVEKSVGELDFRVWVPKPVEIFVRPAIPVGKSGGEWYEFREMSEEEEEMRPKWYF